MRQGDVDDGQAGHDHELGRRDDGQRQASMPGVSVATMISSSGADVPVRNQTAVALRELESHGLRDRMLAGGQAGTPYRGPGLAHTARPAPQGVTAPKQIASPRPPDHAGRVICAHPGESKAGMTQVPMPGVSVATMISSSGAYVPARIQIAVARGELESSGPDGGKHRDAGELNRPSGLLGPRAPERHGCRKPHTARSSGAADLQQGIPVVDVRVSCACASCSFSPPRYPCGCGSPCDRRPGRTPRSFCCATSWRYCSGRRRRGRG